MDFINQILKAVQDFFVNEVVTPLCHIRVLDAVDILLVSFILYTLYRFLRDRRAGRIMIGMLLVLVFGIVVVAVDLPILSYVFRIFASVALFTCIVLFQPEFRDALEHLANLSAFHPWSNRLSKRHLFAAREVSKQTVDAVFKMAETQTGALIVFEGLTGLGDWMQNAKIIDANIQSDLLQNIFFKNSPLHDGALIIRNMRLYAASCVLPSARGDRDFGNMGTRHRAAIGVSEVSDALVIVVSEQTGHVALAQNGALLRNVSRLKLYDALMTYLAGNTYLRAKKEEQKKIKNGVFIGSLDEEPEIMKEAYVPVPEKVSDTPIPEKEVLEVDPEQIVAQFEDILSSYTVMEQPAPEEEKACVPEADPVVEVPTEAAEIQEIAPSTEEKNEKAETTKKAQGPIKIALPKSAYRKKTTAKKEDEE